MVSVDVREVNNLEQVKDTLEQLAREIPAFRVLDIPNAIQLMLRSAGARVMHDTSFTYLFRLQLLPSQISKRYVLAIQVTGPGGFQKIVSFKQNLPSSLDVEAFKRILLFMSRKHVCIDSHSGQKRQQRGVANFSKLPIVATKEEKMQFINKALISNKYMIRDLSEVIKSDKT